MVLKKSAIERALKGKLGCEVDDSGKHRVFSVSIGGQVVAKTHTSFGSDEDLRDRLVKEMADQLRVSKDIFVDIVSCTKYRSDYEANFRPR